MLVQLVWGVCASIDTHGFIVLHPVHISAGSNHTVKAFIFAVTFSRIQPEISQILLKSKATIFYIIILKAYLWFPWIHQ